MYAPFARIDGLAFLTEVPTCVSFQSMMHVILDEEPKKSRNLHIETASVPPHENESPERVDHRPALLWGYICLAFLLTRYTGIAHPRSIIRTCGC